MDNNTTFIKNQVNTNNMTSVDKENLLAELTARLKEEIVKSVLEAVKAANEEIQAAAKSGVAKSRDSGKESGSKTPGNSNRPFFDPTPASTPKQKVGKTVDPDKEFEQLVKIQKSTKDEINKLLSLQRKKERDAHISNLKGKVYSDKGKNYAEDIDHLASRFQSFDANELDDAKQKLSNIKEGIRFSTIGKENDILTKATLSLEKAIEEETKKRGTVLGKVGQYMDKQNINAFSILVGLTESPLVGLLTKIAGDVIRSKREKKQRKNAKKYQIGDLKKILPRQNEPQIEDKNLKLDPEMVSNRLGGKNPDVIHSSLENLASRGHISSEQHDDLKLQLLPPNFEPLWQKMTPRKFPVQNQEQFNSPRQYPNYSNQPQQQNPPVLNNQNNNQPIPSVPVSPIVPVSNKGPAEIKNIADYESRRPQKTETNKDGLLLDNLGNPVRDWQSYRKGTPKKQQHWDMHQAVLHDLANVSDLRQKEQQQEKPPKPADWDEELFGDYHAKPAPVLPERILNEYNNPMSFLKKEPGKLLQMPKRVEPEIQSQAPVEQIPNAVQKPSSNVIPILQSMQKIEQDEDKKLDVFGINNERSPFVRLEKLSLEQLEELKKINKNLEAQINQDDLNASAKKRETPDTKSSIIDSIFPDKKKDDGEKKHGLLGSLMGGVKEIAKDYTIGKVLKNVGLGGAGTKTGGGILNWFKKLRGGKAAEGAVETAEEATGALSKGGEVVSLTKGAKAVSEVEKIGAASKGIRVVSEAGEGMGALGKLGASVKGIAGLGRLGELAEIVPIAGQVIAVVVSVFDFFSGFKNAAAILKKSEKSLTFGDRSSAGLFSVIKGIVGIVDILTGLVGLKTEIGEFAGRMGLKEIRIAFKALKLPWTIIWKTVTVITKELWTLSKFITKYAGKFLKWFFDPIIAGFKVIGKILTPIGKVIVVVAKKFGSMFSSFLDGLEKSIDLLQELVDDPEKAVAKIKDGILSVFGAIGKSVSKILDPDNFKSFTDIIEKIKEFILSPFTFIAEKLGIKAAAPKLLSTTEQPTSTSKQEEPSTKQSWFSKTISKLPETIATALGGKVETQKPTEANVPVKTDGKKDKFATVFKPQGQDKLNNITPQKMGGETSISALATKGESGNSNGNPGIINNQSASKDAGGLSFGSFQIATKTGTMKDFLTYAQKENPKIFQKLERAGGNAGATTGSAQFQNEWKNIAAENPQEFHKLQESFIKNTHYEPQMKMLKKSGIDLSARSNAVQNVVFTMATSEGPGSKTILNALSGKDISKMSDREIITSIYDQKAATLKQTYKNSPELMPGLTKRYGKEGQERTTALSMLEQEQNPVLADTTKDFSKTLATTGKQIDNSTNITKPKTEIEKSSLTPTVSNQPVAQITESPNKPVDVSSKKSSTPLQPLIANSGSTKALKLAQASSANAALNRSATISNPAPSTNVAQSNSSVVQSTTNIVDIKAQNSESTYRRVMNEMYIKT